MTEQNLLADEPSPAAVLRQVMTSYIVPQTLFVAAKLGLADQLAGGAKGGDDLAREIGADPGALRRLLRALAAIGVLVQDGERYGLTATGECLRRGVPGSLHSFVLIAGGEQYRAWGDLLHSLQTGRAAFDHAFGVGYYDYLAAHPEEAALFDESMRETGQESFQPVCDAYDFSGVTTVVDVGGGNGSLIAAVLQANPELRGILFDLPHVVRDAAPALAAAGIADRCEVVGGDFFAAVPAGGECYMLARTLMNWDEGRVLTVLRNCRRVMPPAGRLLVVEPVLPAGSVSAADAFNDLHLLVMGGGRMCTEAEFRLLLAEAGFSLTRVLPTAARMSLIEASPA